MRGWGSSDSNECLDFLRNRLRETEGTTDKRGGSASLFRVSVPPWVFYGLGTLVAKHRGRLAST